MKTAAVLNDAIGLFQGGNLAGSAELCLRILAESESERAIMRRAVDLLAYFLFAPFALVFGAIALIAVPVALILKQPNLSTAIVLCGIWLGMTFAAGVRPLHVGLMALAAGPALYAALALGIVKTYQLYRVVILFFPDFDPSDLGYQNRQTLIAVGNGGWTGIGFANGSQSQGGWLPLLHSDNIYALVAEELGWIGGLVVLLLLGFIILRILRTAGTALDRTGALVCTGVATYLFAQALIHIGVVLHVVPPTGLSLPFISYGGSSLLTAMVALGLVQSVRLCRRPLEFH